jgi:hypothetical protein
LYLSIEKPVSKCAFQNATCAATLRTLPKTGRGPKAVMECGGPVTGVCWTPDDRRVLAAQGNALLVFDAGTGRGLTIVHFIAQDLRRLN